MTIPSSNRWNFRKSEEVPASEAPSVIIPPPPPPPPPIIVSGDLIDLGGGDFKGATNFSEFSVGAGLPSGITAYGISSTSPTTEAIANDVTEGNYFSMDGHSGLTRAFGYGYDAFDGVMEQGEILVRIFTDFDDLVNGTQNIGGAASMSGLVGRPEVSPDFDCWNSSLFVSSGPVFRTRGTYVDDGSGSLPVDGLLQETYFIKTWLWIRVRKFDSADPSKDDWIVTSWFGDLNAGGQPGPDGTATNRTRTISGMAAIGWATSEFCDLAEQRIAFLSFSTTPTTDPPPLPDEVIGGP